GGAGRPGGDRTVPHLPGPWSATVRRTARAGLPRAGLCRGGERRRAGTATGRGTRLGAPTGRGAPPAARPGGRAPPGDSDPERDNRRALRDHSGTLNPTPAAAR